MVQFMFMSIKHLTLCFIKEGRMNLVSHQVQVPKTHDILESKMNTGGYIVEDSHCISGADVSPWVRNAGATNDYVEETTTLDRGSELGSSGVSFVAYYVSQESYWVKFKSIITVENILSECVNPLYGFLLAFPVHQNFIVLVQQDPMANLAFLTGSPLGRSSPSICIHMHRFEDKRSTAEKMCPSTSWFTLRRGFAQMTIKLSTI